jgi:SIR2-like domain
MSITVDVETASLVDQIADAIQKRQCILFLGAAVHAPPPDGSDFVYPEAVRPPLGSALSLSLAQKCGLDGRFPHEDPKDLQRVALFYEIDRTRRQLVEAIREAVHVGKKPSPMLRALADLDFPRVVTTNYDQLFESALRSVGKDPRVSVYTKHREPTRDFPNPTSESPIVFKIHGDIDHEDSIVVTDEDYIRFLLRMGDKDPYDPVPLKLKADLTEWTTLFVGYSLLDYNLRVLFQALRWGIDPAYQPDMFSVDFSPDPLILYVWKTRESLKFVVQNVWAFVPELYERVLGKAIPDYEP